MVSDDVGAEEQQSQQPLTPEERWVKIFGDQLPNSDEESVRSDDDEYGKDYCNECRTSSCYHCASKCSRKEIRQKLKRRLRFEAKRGRCDTV